MSATQAINDINKTLYNVLRESFGLEDQDAQIIFGPPTDESISDNTRAGLYVFLYNIVEDPFYRNLPNEIRGGERILSIRPPLGINLYYMLTPFSPSIEGRESLEDIRAHTLIAKAIRAFYENGIVDPRHFPINTILGRSRVKISSTQMNLEEITKIWGTFNKPFRLSMCYEISIAWVSPAEQAKELFLVEKPVLEGAPAVGKRSLSILKRIGGDIVRVRSDRTGERTTDIRPTVVQPGMALSVFGKNFREKKLIVSINNTDLDESSFRVIDENLLKIKIPPNETAGIKKLSLKADEEEVMEITFEVLPSEAPQIRITEVRPDAGESGDLITIYGINFTDDVTVSIGGIDAENITFVDRAQINVMIPDDLQSGPTTITVRNDTDTASKEFIIK